jgi:hypothetical protein
MLRTWSGFRTPPYSSSAHRQWRAARRGWSQAVDWRAAAPPAAVKCTGRSAVRRRSRLSAGARARRPPRPPAPTAPSAPRPTGAGSSAAAPRPGEKMQTGHTRQTLPEPEPGQRSNRQAEKRPSGRAALSCPPRRRPERRARACAAPVDRASQESSGAAGALGSPAHPHTCGWAARAPSMSRPGSPHRTGPSPVGGAAHGPAVGCGACEPQLHAHTPVADPGRGHGGGAACACVVRSRSCALRPRVPHLPPRDDASARLRARRVIRLQARQLGH